ncbi:MAG: geranylgeranylglycerol-phosphate geranylgeranyltransferase [Cyclobacteriaceae bacterium]
MIRLLTTDLPGFIKASRIPSLLIISITQVFTAVYLVSDFSNKYSIIYSIDFILLIISTLMIAAGGFIINDYYDQKIDMINRPKKVVVGTKFRRRLAMLSHSLLSVTGIAIGFWLDIRIGAIHIFSTFGLWYYSNHLRRLPIIGNMTISFLTSLTLLIVAVFFRRHELLVYVYALFAFLTILVREVIKDIEDVKGEAAVGCQTIPVVWGIRGAKAFIYLVIAAGGSFLVSFLLTTESMLVRYYFLLLIPVFGWFIYKLARSDRQQHYIHLRMITNLIILSGLISMLLI